MSVPTLSVVSLDAGIDLGKGRIPGFANSRLNSLSLNSIGGVTNALCVHTWARSVEVDLHGGVLLGPLLSLNVVLPVGSGTGTVTVKASAGV